MNYDTSGNIPVLHVRGRSIAEMWENSLLSLYRNGKRIKTEYDKPEDPESIDATMTMVAEEPLAEPRIHKAFPGGPAELEEYTQEVCDGIKDFLIDHGDPSKWQYTYHERLTNYQAYMPVERTARETGIVHVEQELSVIDQLQQVALKLVKSPHSRRCYATTGQPWTDWFIADPPCCLGVWFRIMKDKEGTDRLNMNVTFRSRDAYDAAFMNVFAFVCLQLKVACMISQMADRPVWLGRYCDTSYSYHIYGHRLKGKLPNFEDGFLGMVKNRKFYDENPGNSRTAKLEEWDAMMKEAKPEIEKKIAGLKAERGVRA